MKDHSSVEIRNLRTFLAVAETLNFTRAAERLGVTQPSVSVQIRELEEALGAPLFSRLGRHVALTAAGRIFQERSELVLSKLNDACQAVALSEDLTAGHLAVGIIPPLNVPWMPRVLGKLVSKHPGLAVTVIERSSEEVESGVETGRFDVGVGILSNASPNLTYEHLRSDEIFLVTPADGPLAKKRSISAKQLGELHLVLMPEGYLLRQLTAAAFQRARVLPRVALEVDTIEGILATAVHSGLSTLMPRVVLEGRESLGLRAIRLTGWEQSLDFGLFWPIHSERSTAARTFAQCLTEVVRRKR